MSRQLPLFETSEKVWIEPLWRSLGPEKRQEVISILAEIGRASLSGGPQKKSNREETHHES